MSPSEKDIAASAATPQLARKQRKVVIDLTEESDGEVEPRRRSKISESFPALPPPPAKIAKQPASSKPLDAAVAAQKPNQKPRGEKNKNRFGKVFIFATQEKASLPLGHKNQTDHFCISELSLRQQFPVIRRALDMKVIPRLQWDKEDRIIFCPNMPGRAKTLGREPVIHKIIYLDALIAYQASRDENMSWGPELAHAIDESYSAMFQWHAFFLRRLYHVKDEQQRKHFLAVLNCLIAPGEFISKVKSCVSDEQMRAIRKAIDEENDAAEAEERQEYEGEDSEEEAARREKEDDEHRWDDENFLWTL